MKKKKSCLKVYFSCVFALSLILYSTIAMSAMVAPLSVIHVPDDYQTIQEAINEAWGGTVVLVADGIYIGEGNKNLDFNGKAITVQSENGYENCIIDCESNGRGFYFHSGEGEDSILSGFTVRNGQADYGGGIYCCSSSSPTITNCTFSENTANRLGGGIYCSSSSSPTITNCTFSENIANRWGGGIYCSSSSPTITNCTFSENIANRWGGGIHCASSSPTITNCIFSANTANHGAGIVCFGSLIYSPIITNCIFNGNTATGSDTANYGGGIYCGSNASAIITNCLFVGNTSYVNEYNLGCGGIYANTSSLTITNCTFSENTTNRGYGAIYVWGGSTIVTNCICWGDLLPEIKASDYITVNYSNIQGGYTGTGEGNINLNPLFIDSENSDYHLSLNSPCADAGISDGAPNLDIEGNQRPQDEGYDMGAYEYNVSAPGRNPVLFIPGIMGSRMYIQDQDDHLMENELWIPNRPEDIKDLRIGEHKAYIKRQKISDNDNRKDIIGKGYYVNEVYLSFVNNVLKKCPDGSEIFSYDWRIHLRDGDMIILKEGSTGYKTNILANLNDIINKMASKTGKVDIVTHSMGGLLLKSYLNYYKENENSQINKIDKVIMTVCPQLGTPDAIAGLLHGSDMFRLGEEDWIINFPFFQSAMRYTSNNSPAAYSLLPAPKYFDHYSEQRRPIIEIGDAHWGLKKVKEKLVDPSGVYSYDELVKFVASYIDNIAVDPDSHSTDTPCLLDKKYSNSS